MSMAIQSFKCKDPEALFQGNRISRFVAFESAARRKLVQVHAAATLDFLRVPPGNRLEALKDDRVGQHSIRINDQFRACFIWEEAGPKNVEIVDYH